MLRIWRSSAPELLVARVLGRELAGAADGGKIAISDSTIPAGATRSVAVPLVALGGAATEPVNIELVYSFAADEHAQLRDTEVAATMLRTRGVAFAACAR